MLIPSKLSRPLRLQHTVTRSRLLTRLQDAGAYRLVLLHGPAGYGKTTLVAQWAAAQPHLGWFALDESDNQPERFALYLVAAMQQATGGHCVKTEVLAQKHQYANLMTLFGQLFAELADWQHPTFLILDDYHLIENDAIHEAMRFFLRHQPDNLTLVVTSRSQPPLGVANLRVRGQLLELDSQLLAFDHAETRQFFASRLQTPLDELQSDRLCDQVEGWATALQLIALAAPSGEQLLARSVSRISPLEPLHLWDYLDEEVLARVDGETRNLLLRCSLLRSMNDRLIARLTGLDDGQQRLDELARRGLFIQRLDSQSVWFRFHPLFSDFLAHCCARELATELPELHRRAAAGWLELGYPAEAIHHALSARDTTLLRDILLSHGWPLFHAGLLSLLTRCLEALPQATLAQNPSLLLLQAWLVQNLRCYGEVDPQLEQAELNLGNYPLSQLDPVRQAEFDAFRAQVALSSDRPLQARRLAQAALALLPKDRFFSRIVASSVLGEVHHCLGELTSALSVMHSTERMARRHGIYHYVLWALLQQSEILIAQGYLQRAYDIQEKALALVREQHLEQMPVHEFLLRLRSQVLWNWYRLDEAESLARQGLQVLAELKPRQQLQCLAMLARCSLARGDLDNARSLLARCERLLQQGQYHSDWIANADGARLLFWQMSGDKVAARRWLATASRPGARLNHFQQGQWRNIVRAHLLLGELDTATAELEQLIKEAMRLDLFSDLNCNMVLYAVLCRQSGQTERARQALREALELANRTGFFSQFVVEGEPMAELLRQLLGEESLPELERFRAQRLLQEIKAHSKQQTVHFDEQFVSRLLNHPQVPELIRTSPLTQREWQVLGLIYSGYSNEQIAVELSVALTTIKTHIRNLYQKLGIQGRQQAVQQAARLCELIGMAH